jgi:hypothetical protein
MDGLSVTNRGLWVGQICKGIFQNWRGRSRLMEGLALYYWPRVAGADIARKTHAERMMAGTIWVRTNDPTLAHQLTFLVPKILMEYERLMGRRFVQSVRFVTGYIPIDTTIAEEKAEIEVEIPASIKESAAAIEQEELRSTFLRTVGKALQKEYDLRQKGWKPCSCGILTEDGSLCDICRRREEEEKRDVILFYITRYPQRSWEEASQVIPELTRHDWEQARRDLRVKYESQLRSMALTIRKSKKKDQKELYAFYEPAQHYLLFGGEEKDLAHLIGVDLWNELKKLCHVSPSEN